MDFDWKAVVKTVAPTIASVFGTPLAGMGVTAILNAILPDGQPTPTDKPEEFIAKALASPNPEIMMKIKQAEQTFLLDMKKLDIDLKKTLEQFAADNIRGARDLKKEWLRSDKWDYEPILAGLVCVAFGYAEYWVFANAMGESSKMDAGMSVLIGRVLGTVDAAFMLLLSFRWGTSHGSERKTELMGVGQNTKT